MLLRNTDIKFNRKVQIQQILIKNVVERNLITNDYFKIHIKLFVQNKIPNLYTRYLCCIIQISLPPRIASLCPLLDVPINKY